MQPKVSNAKLQKLSKDFTVQCGRDPSKRCILFSKLIFQSLNVWPDSDDISKVILMTVVIISIFIMGLAHFAYLLNNFSRITKMTSACTTVLVSFETVAKLMTIMFHKRQLNEILREIWLNFWPSRQGEIPSRLHVSIRFRSNYVTTVGVSFLVMAFISNAQFMMFPLIHNIPQLPLASWYPFDFQSSPQYEIMYLWQWFSNQIIITTLSGFDSFFSALVMICATQFMILQSRLENLKVNYKEFEDFVVCYKHHLKLLRNPPSVHEMCLLAKAAFIFTETFFRISSQIENIFAPIVFLQFVISTSAICVSCVALIADSTVWAHMLTYLVAHVFQFFIYCSVGSELTYQSMKVADSIYDCRWEKSKDMDFRRGCVLMMLRAQKPVTLSVAGIMQLSYANFIATVQRSFSFYVLLNSFV